MQLRNPQEKSNNYLNAIERVCAFYLCMYSSYRTNVDDVT